MLVQAHRGSGPHWAVPKLLTIAAAHAALADEERRLAPQVAQALIEAGFARYFVPRVFAPEGPGTFQVLSKRLSELGECCTSAAWCALIYATSSRMAAYLPSQGQQQLWRDGSDVPIAASLMPTGKCEPTNGGWLLSGEWHFLSGIDYATWALLCVPAPAGEEVAVRYCAVPAAQYQVRDTWFTLGMRGTGSKTAVLDRVFVPEYLTFPKQHLWEGRPSSAEESCYRIPLAGAHPPLFVAPALGAARHALGLWSEAARTELPESPQGSVYAQSAGELDIVQLMLEHAGRSADKVPLSMQQVARNARDASMAAGLVLSAVERLFRVSGSRVHSDREPLQRLWRDVQTATSHAALRTDRNYALYTRSVWSAPLTDHQEGR
jgi:two-component flavin-dependent monooxygenase